MTDVHIATALIVDAHANAFDDAILVSADSDLVPPVVAIPKLFPHKRVVIAFPPSRFSAELAKAASASFHIGRVKFAHSQFPESITTAEGFVLRRPPTWA